MAIAMACRCGHQFNVRDEHAGKRIKCPSCAKVLDIPASDEPVGNQVLPRMAYPATPPALSPAPQAAAMESLPPIPAPAKPKQYKVMSQKDKWFSGKFDPEKLEEALNSYAAQGWILKAATTASVPGFGGNREEIVFILER